MEREIHITLEYKLSTGNVNLNEIVYRLKELRDPLLIRILEQILKDYDDLIAERLSRTDIYPSKARKGLGRHIRKNDPDVRFCRGRKGELRTVIGITKAGRVEPLGSFSNTPWPEIERTIKKRIKEAEPLNIPFIYDGEPGLDDFLADVAESQRCTWHGSRGLYHSLCQDGLKKKDSQPETDKIKQLICIELPEGDFELLKEEDKQQVKTKYESSKTEIKELIKTFREKGYKHGASYLENLSDRLFTNIELWLKTGVIAPKTTSLLERLFREIGRRLKKIVWGWSDKAVTNISKMIMIRQYSRDKWEKYWKEKLGIKGYCNIQISLVTSECRTF